MARSWQKAWGVTLINQFEKLPSVQFARYRGSFTFLHRQFISPREKKFYTLFASRPPPFPSFRNFLPRQRHPETHKLKWRLGPYYAPFLRWLLKAISDSFIIHIREKGVKERKGKVPEVMDKSTLQNTRELRIIWFKQIKFPREEKIVESEYK